MSSYDVERRIQLIRHLLPTNASRLSFVEIGCGTGRISAALKPLTRSYTVSDISAPLAKQTGERLGLPWRQIDACKIDLPDNSQDLVVSSECIEHVSDPLQAVSEFARVVRPGGYVVITSPNPLWFPVLKAAMAMGVRRFRGPENWVSVWNVRRHLQRHGFSSFRISGCHLFPWQLPAAKKILPYADRLGDRLFPLMINWGISAQKTV